ncbi:hypothetical protein TEQG_08668 [Trichophyton equinum CBS 127.97]|uniref:Uncharacterized protein n=1 Tax=Trichophyton equinum (strain ATCC MYA-4606 / CBS 127.97) TaxID=559882 RepID=F2PRC9_TRIEC|nr:hypothetical protein TEQG_08668 [Trichophyton equinum CBS 127.97]
MMAIGSSGRAVEAGVASLTVDGTWPKKRTAVRVLAPYKYDFLSRHGQGSGKQRPTHLKRQPRKGRPPHIHSSLNSGEAAGLSI